MIAKVAPKESAIQRQIIGYLGAVGIVSAHVPNGAVLAGDPTRRAIQMNSLKSNGFRVGFPDLILLKAGAVGFFEVKREGEKLSENQIFWRGELERLGLPWACVRSIEDAQESLQQWGWA